MSWWRIVLFIVVVPPTLFSYLLGAIFAMQAGVWLRKCERVPEAIPSKWLVIPLLLVAVVPVFEPGWAQLTLIGAIAAAAAGKLSQLAATAFNTLTGRWKPPQS